MNLLLPDLAGASLTDPQILALHNVSYTRSAELANPGTCADDFHIGQVVTLFSRNGFRTAVVVKVGRKNVTVLYATEGGIAEAIRTADMFAQRNSPAGRRLTARQCSERYRSDFAFWTAEANPATAKYRDDRSGTAASADAFVKAHPDVDVYVAEQTARAIAETERQAAQHWTEHLNFTTKAAKFSEVGR
jgi:hypothetical protein